MPMMITGTDAIADVDVDVVDADGNQSINGRSWSSAFIVIKLTVALTIAFTG